MSITGVVTKPLLDLIASVESEPAVAAQRAGSAYDVVWGGIRHADYPPHPLVAMRVSAVLDWQDSIDPEYNSEAAGRYQILEDTLRDLVRTGKVDRGALFSGKTQDAAAVALLERRGLTRFLSGKMSVTDFGNSIAKEWASLPVLTDQPGAKGWVSRGQSYYARDGLNKAHLKPQQVETALLAIQAQDAPAVPDDEAIVDIAEMLAEHARQIAVLNKKFAAIASAAT